MIDSFQGEHRWLSNFWPAVVLFEGETYPSVEHAYVAAKTLDLELRREIRTVNSPGSVKRIGRGITLRPDWEAVKLEVMEHLLREKFKDPTLRSQLIATADQELVEGNHWGDTFWGVCRGVGQNNLGRLLMKIRSEVQS